MNPFEILGIPKDYLVAMNRDELMKLAESQYKRFQKLFHPDLTYGKEHISKNLSLAIETLRDPDLYEDAVLEIVSPKEDLIKNLQNKNQRLEKEVQKLKQEAYQLKSKLMEDVKNQKEVITHHALNITIPNPSKEKRDFLYIFELDGYKISYTTSFRYEVDVIYIEGYKACKNKTAKTYILSGSIDGEYYDKILKDLRDAVGDGDSLLGNDSFLSLKCDQFMHRFSLWLRPYLKLGDYLVLSEKNKIIIMGKITNIEQHF